MFIFQRKCTICPGCPSSQSHQLGEFEAPLATPTGCYGKPSSTNNPVLRQRWMAIQDKMGEIPSHLLIAYFYCGYRLFNLKKCS